MYKYQAVIHASNIDELKKLTAESPTDPKTSFYLGKACLYLGINSRDEAKGESLFATARKRFMSGEKQIKTSAQAEMVDLCKQHDWMLLTCTKNESALKHTALVELKAFEERIEHFLKPNPETSTPAAAAPESKDITSIHDIILQMLPAYIALKRRSTPTPATGEKVAAILGQLQKMAGDISLPAKQRALAASTLAEIYQYTFKEVDNFTKWTRKAASFGEPIGWGKHLQQIEAKGEEKNTNILTGMRWLREHPTYYSEAEGMIELQELENNADSRIAIAAKLELLQQSHPSGKKPNRSIYEKVSCPENYPAVMRHQVLGIIAKLDSRPLVAICYLRQAMQTNANLFLAFELGDTYAMLGVDCSKQEIAAYLQAAALTNCKDDFELHYTHRKLLELASKFPDHKEINAALAKCYSDRARYILLTIKSIPVDQVDVAREVRTEAARMIENAKAYDSKAKSPAPAAPAAPTEEKSIFETINIVYKPAAKPTAPITATVTNITVGDTEESVEQMLALLDRQISQVDAEKAAIAARKIQEEHEAKEKTKQEETYRIGSRNISSNPVDAYNQLVKNAQHAASQLLCADLCLTARHVEPPKLNLALPLKSYVTAINLALTAQQPAVVVEGLQKLCQFAAIHDHAQIVTLLRSGLQELQKAMSGSTVASESKTSSPAAPPAPVSRALSSDEIKHWRQLIEYSFDFLPNNIELLDTINAATKTNAELQLLIGKAWMHRSGLENYRKAYDCFLGLKDQGDAAYKSQLHEALKQLHKVAPELQLAITVRFPELSPSTGKNIDDLERLANPSTTTALTMEAKVAMQIARNDLRRFATDSDPLQSAKAAVALARSYQAHGIDVAEEKEVAPLLELIEWLSKATTLPVPPSGVWECIEHFAGITRDESTLTQGYPDDVQNRAQKILQADIEKAWSNIIVVNDTTKKALEDKLRRLLKVNPQFKVQILFETHLTTQALEMLKLLFSSSQDKRSDVIAIAAMNALRYAATSRDPRAVSAAERYLQDDIRYLFPRIVETSNDLANVAYIKNNFQLKTHPLYKTLNLWLKYYAGVSEYGVRLTYTFPWAVQLYFKTQYDELAQEWANPAAISNVEHFVTRVKQLAENVGEVKEVNPMTLLQQTTPVTPLIIQQQALLATVADPGISKPALTFLQTQAKEGSLLLQARLAWVQCHLRYSKIVAPAMGTAEVKASPSLSSEAIGTDSKRGIEPLGFDPLELLEQAVENDELCADAIQCLGQYASGAQHTDKLAEPNPLSEKQRRARDILSTGLRTFKKSPRTIENDKKALVLLKDLAKIPAIQKEVKSCELYLTATSPSDLAPALSLTPFCPYVLNQLAKFHVAKKESHRARLYDLVLALLTENNPAAVPQTIRDEAAPRKVVNQTTKSSSWFSDDNFQGLCDKLLGDWKTEKPDLTTLYSWLGIQRTKLVRDKTWKDALKQLDTAFSKTPIGELVKSASVGNTADSKSIEPPTAAPKGTVAVGGAGVTKGTAAAPAAPPAARSVPAATVTSAAPPPAPSKMAPYSSVFGDKEKGKGKDVELLTIGATTAPVLLMEGAPKRD